MRNLKLYGGMRTCTNYLAWLVEKNLADVTVWHDGGEWKHSLEPRLISPPMHGYLLTAKHPLSWIDSMLRYRPAPLPTLVEQWNAGTRARWEFERAHPDLTIFVPYEMLLGDHVTVIDAIAERFGLEPARAPYIDCERHMKRGGDNLRLAVTQQPFDRTYYTEERWRERFTPAEVSAIAVDLDADLCAALGYEVSK